MVRRVAAAGSADAFAAITQALDRINDEKRQLEILRALALRSRDSEK